MTQPSTRTSTPPFAVAISRSTSLALVVGPSSEKSGRIHQPHVACIEEGPFAVQRVEKRFHVTEVGRPGDDRDDAAIRPDRNQRDAAIQAGDAAASGRWYM
jgi:hypothetical protein